MNTSIIQSFLNGFMLYKLDNIAANKFGDGRIHDNCGFSLGLSIDYTICCYSYEEEDE